MKIVTAAEMRRLEQESAAAGISTDQLMENAGLAIARVADRLLGGALQRRVVVMVGPGNNGGDGLVAARHLARWGASVVAYLVAPRRQPDPKADLAAAAGVRLVALVSPAGDRGLRDLLARADLAIDAILGTGSARPMQGTLREAALQLEEAHAARRRLPVLAVDLPSGVNADTGAADPATPHADVTVTLGFPKLGLFHFPAAEYVGHLETVDIGVPEDLAYDITLALLSAPGVAALLPPRPLYGHKGTFGRVLVVGGSRWYIGAPLLAGLAAARTGAGLVQLAAPAELQPSLAASAPEPVHLPLPQADGALVPEAAAPVLEAAGNTQALVLGCGMSQTNGARAFVRTLVERLRGVPTVIDADGLSNLARVEGWHTLLQAPAVLTPHPGEMGRLIGLTAPQVNADRIHLAQRHAAAWRCVVVLKGAYTVVAAPDGRTLVSPFANPALGSAGTGDVLAGVIGGLLAQGLTPYDAACAGVYLHGFAAERLRRRQGDAGLLASDLLSELPLALRDLRAAGPHAAPDSL